MGSQDIFQLLPSIARELVAQTSSRVELVSISVVWRLAQGPQCVTVAKGQSGLGLDSAAEETDKATMWGVAYTTKCTPVAIQTGLHALILCAFAQLSVSLSQAEKTLLWL